MIRRPPRSTRVRSSAASDVYKRQGQWSWWARLTCHLGILRLMTRGAERRRRAGLRRLISRRRKVSQSRSGAMSSGGKGALVGHGLAADPERGDEADAVRVVAGMRGGVGHQGADRVVAVSYTHLRAHETVLDLVCR